MAFWQIDSIDITGGFIGGLTLKLPRGPGLTCIIGPRGSGKSTLIEAIRHGLGTAIGGIKSRLDLIQANLGTSIINIRTAPDEGGTAYIVSRRPRQLASITTADGRPINNVDLERGTFLPLDAFSSIEIESIADESLGEKRRTLLDDLQGPEYREIIRSLAEHRRALESNADAIRNTKRKIQDLIEQIEELGDARAKLALLPPPEPDNNLELLDRASKQQQTNANERRNLNSAIQAQAELAATIQRFIETKLDIAGDVRTFAGSPNIDLLRQANIIAHESVEFARVQLAEIQKRLKDSERSLRELHTKLSAAHTEQDASYQELQIKNAEASKAIQDRINAQQAVTNLEELEAARNEAHKHAAALLEARTRLKGAYLLERERISALRESIASKLEHEAGKRVRVRVLRNADNLAYRQMLLDGLRGARVRNHDDILAALLKLRPEELAEFISDNAVSDFDKHTTLGEERSRKILDAFRTNLDPLFLEVVDIEDRISIELNVGTEKSPNHKDASELSRGQKCTALLPLLMARRNTPLIIDQPEDNLDNHFIYETVVESIRRLKLQRQMIFVTHNANIPVLGEADLVIVMNSDGRRGFVSKSGTVDECREEIVDLLEGGPEAFELRRRRYERRHST